MFAPKATKAQSKEPASSMRKPVPQRSTLAGRSGSCGAVERAGMLHRSIGNQAMLRLLAQRATYPVGDGLDSSQSGTTVSAQRFIQAKLIVGKVDDPLEHEADSVADRVMRMADPVPVSHASAPQISRKCAECEAEEKVLTKHDGTGTAAGAPAVVEEALRSPSRPLDAATRAFFEPRLGRSLDKVRVHTGARAADSARAVGAQAYTVGEQIVFNSGRYAPSTDSGRHLLAHELAHTLQQRESRVGGGGIVRRQTEADPKAQPEPDVYICSKDLQTAPLGRHSFFRIGGPGSGNPTYELEPEDNRPFKWIDGDLRHSGCWQGVPKQDVDEDKNYNPKDAADCQKTSISLGCLKQQFAAYPIGRYCTFGPNSNSFVAYIAGQCGLSNPNPKGWNPGIGTPPPAEGTYAPSPNNTLFGCELETGCGVAVASEQSAASKEQPAS